MNGLSLFGYANFAASKLPPGWNIQIEIENGSADVLLFGSGGDDISAFASCEDMFEDRCKAAVDFARECEGLKPADWTNYTD